jgi:hypothetical protein
LRITRLHRLPPVHWRRGGKWRRIPHRPEVHIHSAREDSLEASMDETVLIAKAQMRVLCRAAGLSPDTFERQFDAVFDAPPDQKDQQPSKRGRLHRKRTEKASDQSVTR